MKIFLFLVFLFNPALSIGLTLLYVLSNNKDSSWTYVRMLMVEMAVYLALINTTKELTGDFLNYSERYITCISSGFLDYIFFVGKEPVFFGSMWIVSRLADGNWSIFVFIFTAINYLVVYEALSIIARSIKSSVVDVAVCVVIYALFFQNFAMIGNAVRQCLSQSFALLFFAKLYFENKRNWLLVIVSIFIHSASIPIIGVGLIPVINKRFTIRRLILVLTLTLVSAVAVFKVSAFDNLPFVGYIFSRLEDEEQLEGADSWMEEVGLSTQYYFMLLIVVITIAFVYIKTKDESKCYSFGLLNLTIILIVAILYWNFSGAYYLCMRYQFYLYTLQIVPILYTFNKYNYKFKIYLQWFICAFLPLYFYRYLGNGVFKYVSVAEALIWSPFHYFF